MRDAPVRHSQKQPCYAPPLFHLLPHLHACGVRCVGDVKRDRGRIPVVSRGARCPRSALGLNLCANRGRIPVVSRGARCPRSALGLNLCANRGRIPVVSRGARCPRSALAKTAVLRTASFSFALTSARLRCAMWEQMKNSPWRGLFLLVGAGGRTRTDTDFTPQDFESSASASFTTPAQMIIYHIACACASVLGLSALFVG